MTGVRVLHPTAVGGHEGAVEGDVTPAGGPSGLQHLMKLRGLSGQYVDALVQIAVARRGRHSGVAGQDRHAGVLPEPAQHQHRLVEAGGGAGADAGAPAAPLGDEQLDQLRGGVGGYVKRGRVGDHAGSSRSWSVP
jgi:hypothetical protein